VHGPLILAWLMWLRCSAIGSLSLAFHLRIQIPLSFCKDKGAMEKERREQIEE